MYLELLNKISIINNVVLESRILSDDKEIVKKFVDAGRKVLKADYGYAFRWNKVLKSFDLFYRDNKTPFISKIPPKHGITAKVFQQEKPYYIDHASSLRSDAKKFMEGAVVIPMTYHQEKYGTIDICFYDKHVFAQEEKIICEYIGNSVAEAIRINHLNKKTERDSQKLLKQKDEFFNIASHELKTPVAAIKGFVQILNQKMKKVSPETSYFLDKINLHTDKLSRLVNDLLDVSRIETGKLKFKKITFELSDLLKEVIEGVDVALPHHSISFKNSHRFWIRGDSEHIERVIINLLTNAAKYSPVGSKIKVSLEEKDGKARVNVEDFGIGINKKDQLKIFKRFFQSKDSSKSSGLPGLGLGLYIAREILKHHGGELHFESKRESKGSIFYFLLPYSKHRIIKK